MPAQFTRFGMMITVVFLLPWLALIVLGGYWLWQQGWLLQGVGVLSANVALVYGLLHWRSHRAEPLFMQPFAIQPNPNWSDKAQQAWQELASLSERWQTETDFLTDSTKALKLTNEVLTLVARNFHADSTYPILEFPLPYLLKLIVLVCEDIQHEVLDKIPGSHAVRVGDLLRAKQAVDTLTHLKSIFNVGNWLFNWSGAALAKARSLLFNKGMNTVTHEISQRLMNAYINKLGYYAIQLYSGQITLDDIVPTDRLSAASKADIAESQAQNQSIEPLRLLLLGQVSSGKSSLINALFGEIKSAEGLLPTTAEITPYLLERDGLQQAVILDSAGYGGLMHNKAPVALKQAWDKVDVILMVCNATQAARQVDVQQLNAIRHYFQEQCPNQALPVIIAVATHCDRLRPIREWQPPYNIQQPDNAKEHSIRQACVAIAQDMNLPLDCIVPVCLAAEKPAYNIEDGLMPLIHDHLNAAQRVRYLRCLRQHQAESYWQQWRKQALQAGQVILSFSEKGKGKS
ncbi:GTP-binding protein HSR1-like protein [Crenothrix polyspora]|uniref:GTP-binding protein HSR1-like protein n=1 Tax=Crenothrix polyspora TaxID=360316 RepID=A0A1R4H1I4_9GAMM|nr:GTPase [Crenothrix polyspora]SJM90075.1 GTP-binding protein HSR1-like protein [Crenothrix polyspora]